MTSAMMLPVHGSFCYSFLRNELARFFLFLREVKVSLLMERSGSFFFEKKFEWAKMCKKIGFPGNWHVKFFNFFFEVKRILIREKERSPFFVERSKWPWKGPKLVQVNLKLSFLVSKKQRHPESLVNGPKWSRFS